MTEFCLVLQYRGCTLHLAQQFQFNRTYKPQAILSSANAPGLVMGSGVLGDSLKPTNESIAVYMSTDGGINWEEVSPARIAKLQQQPCTSVIHMYPFPGIKTTYLQPNPTGNSQRIRT